MDIDYDPAVKSMLELKVEIIEKKTFRGCNDKDIEKS